MSSKSAAKGHFLLCPVCRRTWPALSLHLCRTCMKLETPEAIAAAVETAEADARQLLESGRVFSYSLLCQIQDDADPLSRMVEELQRRHMVVTGSPLPPPPPGAATQPAAQCIPGIKWTTPNRKLMAERGLYRRHSLDAPLLMTFHTYLQRDLHISNCKQEVENVARFLFYMDPSQPSLDFVRDTIKTEQYLCELTEANLGAQTVQKYLKSMKRFLTCYIDSTNLRQQDQSLHESCKTFFDFLSCLQKSYNQKRREMLPEKNPKTPFDCLAVLRAAKQDFLQVLGKVNLEEDLELAECVFVMCYLQAVVILRHLQRPGVVKHMTVEEWLNRTADESGHVVVCVVEQQEATFALSAEEGLWFETYYTRVRPQLLSSNWSRRDDTDDNEQFFISTTGRRIYNPCNDLKQLQIKYKLEPVNSQTARRAFETTTMDTEKYLLVHYLTSSEQKHLDVVRASQLLAHLAAGSSAEPPDSESTGAAARDAAGGSNWQMTIEAAYDELVRVHPVTLDGEVPPKELRSQTNPVFQRQLYERWLKAQNDLRRNHVVSHFSWRLPTENRVCAWIAKQAWEKNVPSASDIVSKWTPFGSVDKAMKSKVIRRLVRSQKWKGLIVQDIEGKGKGVVVTRTFQAGEVVCDYHGQVVTATEGQAIHSSTSEEETGHMFFYTDTKGQDMCIDAHLPACECHPGKETFGRLIKHSRRRHNIKPRLYAAEDGDQQQVILFLATRDVEAGEELLFNYGAQRKSFRGAGLDLDWL